MKKRAKGVKEIPASFTDIDEADDFWDAHSLADYGACLTEVEADVELNTVRHMVALDGELLDALTDVARAKGISTETLVNLWLKDKLAKAG